MGYSMTDGFGTWGGWGMAFGGFMMIFWFAVLVALIMFIVRWSGGNTNEVPRTDAAQILKQRYARGEIDAGEYEERLQFLQATD
ncbi:hypothetical protein MNBD_ALPHA11-458 [hydrothermal vent metagenome]|uniref:SHOCT domain-containing protein n=1 Tax=hydrothermal vent metagenome TaxID=652676 RepID=A0A3B0TUV8_9ZZZZ